MQTENWLGQTGERGAYKPQSEILNRQGHPALALGDHGGSMVFSD
jgi:hypothetical protein